MTASPVLTGRCLCGAIRYQAGAPLYRATYCHCASCRRAAGAHAIAWVTVPVESFRLLGSEPRSFASSPGVRRTFCGCCGSPLSYWVETRPDEIDLTVGTLDDSAPWAPADHIWMADAPVWDRPGDGLPEFPGARPLR